MNKKIVPVLFVALFALGGVLTGAQESGEMQKTQIYLADVVQTGSGLAWVPRVPNDGIEVLVAAPSGEVVQKIFPSWENPFLDLAELGMDRQDGSYTWEIRIIPLVDESIRAEMVRVRELGDAEAAREIALRVGNGLPASQSGAFRVEGGVTVLPGDTEFESAGAGSSLGQGSSGLKERTEDQVFADDLIVQGSACVGMDCVNNENFGFDTLRIKENNTRIKFNDTSVGSFPTNDWTIVANDSDSGGASYLGFENVDAGTFPFRVMAGAGNNALYVDAQGDVGIGTSAPVLELQVTDGDSPALRLEQNNSSGFTAQTWDVVGNEANFFVRDVTNSSRLPFRIFPGSGNDDALVIKGTGDVGLGTDNPTSRLHVAGDAYVEGDARIVGALKDSLDGPGTAGQVLTSTATGTAWTDVSSTSDPDAVIGNEVLNAADATLIRSGSGTTVDPYLLALNLGNANTWSAQQTFGDARVGGSFYDAANAPGTSGQVLLSTGSGISWGDSPSDPDAVIGNEVLNSADGTLTRSGAGTAGDPYRLALNLGNANTWSAQQTFGDARVGGSFYDASNSAGSAGQVLFSTGSGISWSPIAFPPDGDWTISGNDMYSNVSGNIGIGTMTPSARLHLRQADGSARFFVEETGAAGPQELLRLASNGAVGLSLADSTAGSWSLFSASGNLVANDSASPASPKFSLEANGNLTISGILTQGCSIDIKENFVELSGSDILDRIAELPMVEWSYIADPTRHAGPMAEDFHAAFGLGADEKHMAPYDAAGIALAAVQELKRRNEALEEENRKLEARLAALERAVLGSSENQ